MQSNRKCSTLEWISMLVIPFPNLHVQNVVGPSPIGSHVILMPILESMPSFACTIVAHYQRV